MALWTTEQDNAVVTATYTNPPMNYFCRAAMGELAELIDQWRAPEVRAVVLTGGAEGQFVTHYSVEELIKLADREDLVRSAGSAMGRSYHELLRKLIDLPKPVIAALNGDAMGGGFELALACDIRIAQAGDYRIGLPEATLGLLPGGSGTQRLTRLLGAGRAIDVLLRGRICRPEAALALGLVHEVADDARAHAREVAQGLAGQSAAALSAIKRAVYQGGDGPLNVGLEVEGFGFMQTLLSPESRARMVEYVSLPLDRRRDWLEREAVLMGTNSSGPDGNA